MSLAYAGVRGNEQRRAMKSPAREAGVMIETQTQEWFEILTDGEREECGADLTDAYFAALNTDAWTDLESALRRWRDTAEQKQLIAV